MGLRRRSALSPPIRLREGSREDMRKRTLADDHFNSDEQLLFAWMRIRNLVHVTVAPPQKVKE